MRSMVAGLLVGTTIAGACTSALANDPAGATPAKPHNVVLFVADGLRPTSVTPRVAPTMAMLMREGTHFPNSHSLFPTFTTANASALATGHLLGDTGDFSNTIFSAFPGAGRQRQHDAVPGE